MEGPSHRAYATILGVKPKRKDLWVASGGTFDPERPTVRHSPGNSMGHSSRKRKAPSVTQTEHRDPWLLKVLEIAGPAMAGVSGPDTMSFADAIRPHGLQLQEGEHDPLVARGLRALHAVLTFHPDGAGGAVYRPWFQGGISLEQLTDDDLRTLEAALSCSNQPAYQARLGDVLFLSRRGFTHAQSAIDHYVDLIANTPPSDWTKLVFPVERVTRLASGLGPKSPERTRVREWLSASFRGATENTTDRDLLFWPAVLAEALLGCFPKEEAQTVAEGCRGFAHVAHVDGRERYLQLSAEAHRVAGDEAGAKATLKHLGDHHLSRAEDASREGAFHLEANCLEAAVSTYREAGERALAEALIPRIQEAYRRFSGTMTEVEIPAPELAAGFAAIQRSFDDTRGAAAIAAFVSVHSPTRLVDARSAIASREGFVFPIFPSRLLTPEGNVARRSPGKTDNEPTDAEILEHYHFAQAVAGAFLEHARQRIHLSRDESWVAAVSDLVAGSEFVHADRRPQFERALIAGMRGDGVLLTHLIIPQLENSLRARLGLADGKTTSVKDGVMQERSLNELVRDPILAEILGEDLLWEIRALLTEEPSNLRNRVCHGLASPEDCEGQTAAMVLWLSLFLVRKYGSGNGPAPSETNGGSGRGEEGD